MKKRIILSIVIAMASALSCMAAQNVKKYAISKSAMLDRLMAYLAIESGSEEADSPDVYPITEGQKQMAQKLAADAKALGAEVTLSEWYYVYRIYCF